MNRHPRTILLLLGLLVSPGGTRLLASALDEARAMINTNRWSDAKRYIDQALQENEQSWMAQKLMGDYLHDGAKRPRDAFPYYKKAWTLVGNKNNLSDGFDKESYDDLGKKYTRLEMDRGKESLNRLGVAGLITFLEGEIFTEKFYSIPLLIELFKAYVQAGSPEKISEAFKRLPGQDEGLDFTTKNYTWGNLYYYAYRASTQARRYREAYLDLKNAQGNGYEVSDKELEAAGQAISKELEETMAQGRSAFQKEDWLKAHKIFEEVKAVCPLDVPLYGELETLLDDSAIAVEIDAVRARVAGLKKAGKYDDALALIDKTLGSRREPSDNKVLAKKKDLELERATLESEATQSEADRKKRAAERDQKYIGMIDKARISHTKEEYLQAVKLYKEALEIKSTPIIEGEMKRSLEKAKLHERYEQGISLFGKRDMSRAVKELEEVEREDIDFKRTEVQKALAMAYFGLKQAEKAEKHAAKVLDHREDKDLLLALADYYEERAESRVDRKTALAYLDRYKKVVGESDELKKRMENLYWEIHKLEFGALTALILVYVLSFIYVKKKSSIMKNLALSELERRMGKSDFAGAVELYDRFQDSPLDPKEEVTIRQHFQRALYEVHQYQRAISEGQKLLKNLPENKQIRIQHAKCLYRLKNISQESLQYYFDFLESDPDHRELMIFMGQFCTKKKILNPETLTLLRNLAELTPDDDSLRSLLIRGYMKDNDRTPQAIALYEVEKKKNPKNVEVRVVLAEYYLKKGEVTRTIEECEDLLNLELQNKRIHEVLIKAYQKLNKIHELVAVYRSILDQDPHNPVVQEYIEKLTSGEKVVSESSTKIPKEALAGVGADGKSANLSCPRCGKAVAVGAYFCTCGQPL